MNVVCMCMCLYVIEIGITKRERVNEPMNKCLGNAEIRQMKLKNVSVWE